MLDGGVFVPAMITHLLCGQGVLRGLRPAVADAINRHIRLYDIGTQGPDMFFYRPRGATAGIGRRMHDEAVGNFLAAMSAGLVALGSKDKEAAFAYFAGFLCHYAMDAAAHPYVYFKTGFDEEGKLSGRYSIYHITFESAIDTLLLEEKEGKSPADEKLWRRFSRNRRAVRATAMLVADSVNVAYKTKLAGGHVLSVMARMALASRFLRSRLGHWRNIVCFFENIVTGSTIWSALIHRQEIGDDIDYLNKSKTHWQEPWEGGVSRNDAFYELFDHAKKDACQMINALWAFLQGESTHKELLNILGDRSFNSGRPLGEKRVFRVHDIVFRR